MALKRVLEGCERLSKFFAIIVGWALLCLSLLIGIDVVGRKLFNVPLQGSDEIGGYIMALLCVFGFSYALSQEAHIRLRLLFPKLPLTIRAFLNLLAYGLLLTYAYMMCWQVITVLINSYRYKSIAPTVLQTPLVIPQSFVTIGLAWFALHMTIYFLQHVRLIISHQIPETLLENHEKRKE
ncbi:MAG: TRAP transporter small permease [Deltaproteobacteria bacterium]|nr:TRAP transporter small permease [Deltaproteobacteria bacterium]